MSNHQNDAEDFLNDFEEKFGRWEDNPRLLRDALSRKTGLGRQRVMTPEEAAMTLFDQFNGDAAAIGAALADAFARPGTYPHWICYDLDAQLAYPHYSDPIWNTPQILYSLGKNEQSSAYVNVSEMDFTKKNKAWDKVETKGRNGRAWQEFLSHYFDTQITLVTLSAWTNRGNGYTAFRCGYRIA